MKNLILSVLVLSLCSCGSDQSASPEKTKANKSSFETKSPYVLPALNFKRSVSVDSVISSLYEDMTINPTKNGSVLGDEAFYVIINQGDAYQSEMKLGFYSKTKVNSIHVFDTKNTLVSLTDLTKENLSALRSREVTDFDKHGLTWGQKNLDRPENDMLNKIYIVRTEETERAGSDFYKANSTYLIWFDCQGAMKAVSDLAYSCSKLNLKFNYKLLDYSLTSDKV